MTHIVAPNSFDSPPSVFLAGGITNCHDWQADAVRNIEYLMKNVLILNPRRPEFDMSDPTAARAQIEWEFAHLRRADVILFWFTDGPSPQPIALYELGRWAALGKPLAVGAHRDYLREEDVRVQMALARPDLHVRSTLATTCEDAVWLLKGGKW